jgi:undecaprenyl-diphosphatase
VGRQRHHLRDVLVARRHQHALHHHPPVTPAGLLLRHRFTVPILIATFCALAFTAHYDGGRIARKWDEPVTRFLQDHRRTWLNTSVEELSALGGLIIVVLIAVLLVGLVWHECRALALTLVMAGLARPLLEWTLKELIDRQRPDIGRLVPGEGPSFPSGHVMAAIAIWGLLPPVLALISGQRFVWWVSVWFSGAVIVLVAFSRVYLGVHWLTDVVGAMVLGALYLLAMEWLLDWHHRRRPCHAVEVSFATAAAKNELPHPENLPSGSS